ncbi:MAG: cytochrome c-type biogenesis protein CcmH [Gammaproteobacteria bacterium]|nr:cytochrome c-type biogenesis protein CcmH [Gammaproteobacteria bacterium]
MWGQAILRQAYLTQALLLCLLLLPGSGWAVIETYEFSSDELRERYRVLTNELRCPKCQNQNIADSNAPIAKDLRQQLHRQLHAGRSDAEITEYMVARYGDFVLYRPRWEGPTLWLWMAPLIFLVLAVLVFLGSVRRARARPGSDSGMSETERQRVAALTGEEQP